MKNILLNKTINSDLQHLYYSSNFIDWQRLRGKTILITGANGMIASYAIYMLIYLNELEKDFNINIIASCRDERKLRDKFDIYVDRDYFKAINLDLSNSIALGSQKVDFIIHAASPAGTEQFLNNPVGVIIPNTIGTYNLLEYARVNDIEGFLFMSSNSIYGTCCEDADDELDENDYGIVDPLNDRACYIESKRLAEQMCNSYTRQYKTHAKIVRIGHTYGPTLDIYHDKRVISRICYDLLYNENIELFKDSNSNVQYGYIVDVISGCFKVLFDGVDGEAYNVCGDEFLLMHNIAEIIISQFPNTKSKIIYKEVTNDYKFGIGKGITNKKCSNLKLKNLGWKVEFSLAEGFKRSINSWLQDKTE